MTASLAFLSSLRIVSRTAGARFLERAVPLYAGLLLTAAVLFGPTGVQPRDVGALAAESPGVRVALWTMWLLLAAPLSAVLLRDRRADFLRAMPIAREAPFLAFAVWLLAAELPWALFWAAAGGSAAGAKALVLGAGLSILVARRPRGALEAVALAGAAIAVVSDAPPFVALALGPALFIAVQRVWLRASERTEATGAAVRGPALVALAIAYGLRLARVERIALLRSATVSVAGGFVAAIAVRNGGHLGTTAISSVFLGAIAPGLVLAATPLGAPLLAADRSLDVVARSSGASDALRRTALQLVGMAAGAAGGALAFGAARLTAGLPLELAPITIAMAALAMPMMIAIEARLRRPRKSREARDEGGRVLVAVLASAIVLGLMAFAFEAWVVLVLGAIGIAMTAPDWLVRRRAPRTRSDDAVLLSIESLHKRFGAKLVLEGASLAVERGTIAVLRGENGSGKSTLLRIVAGVIEPDRGVVSIAGRDLSSERTLALRSVGYAADAAELPDHLSVDELVTLVSALKAAQRDPEEESRLGVDGLMDQRLGALSLGQRRRVGLATALIGAPALLLFDEPTNGLDAAGLDVLSTILSRQRERGGSALVASHEAGFAARIANATFTLALKAVTPGTTP